MKILVINPGFLPNPAVKGGAVENLTDMYLESSKLSNINFVVYSRYDEKVNGLKNSNTNVEYRYIKKSSKVKEQFKRIVSKISGYRIGNCYIQEIIKDIISKNEKDTFDYVIVENTYQYVISLNKFLGNKIILHQHNCLNTQYLSVCKNAIRRCKEIYTVSDYVKRQIESIEKGIIVKVLFNGIKLENFGYIKESTLFERYNISDNDIVFCYVGRVVKEKGILELLEAFSELEKEYNNIKLLIIGSQNFLKNEDKFLIKCKRIIENLKDKVIFTGFIDYSKINCYYSMADIQVVPSIVDDSCPMAVIEGMSVGLAQIVTDSGGIPEEVTSKNAIIVSRENLKNNLFISMKKLCDNKELVNKMKTESFNRSKEFSSEKYVDTLKHFLLEIQ